MTPIEDYALIGDRRTAALISAAGSVDWLCLPNFDSSACFAALLGGPEHGRWLIGPEDEATSTRRYVDGTLVLETTHRTSTGTVRVLDLMPDGKERVNLIRRIEGMQGVVRMRHELVIRFGYGKVVPWVHRSVDTSVHGCGEQLVALAGPDRLLLSGPVLPKATDHRHADVFEIRAGQVRAFDLSWSHSFRPRPEPLDIDAAVGDCVTGWREWLSNCRYDGQYPDAVHRSLLALRAMTDQRTGGIVAAPTTSLPEDFGGERNWDYRFCWLRDASLTVKALADLGMTDHALHWHDWLLRAIAGDPDDLQIMYTVNGGRELPERTLDHLPGYADSRPVRVGNGAVEQRQHDVYGEVMVALQHLRDAGIDPSPTSWAMQRALVTSLADRWQEPDHGLWEIRGPQRQFTHSRALVWAAFDRGVRGVEQHGLNGPVEAWRQLRDVVREEVLDKGFNAQINSFTQHYQTTEVDASLLLLPQVGLLPADDPRMLATVARIEQELIRDGLVMRYRTQSGVDGLSGDEHPFLACSFWLVTVYAMQGRIDDATALMDRLLGLRNDVGLLAEEYDPVGRKQVGNFPQAFSHLALLEAAVALQRASTTR